MQDRYAGDVGDYVKLALLRAISPGHRVGVIWYLYPDEYHNGDGRHIDYLDTPQRWRHLDPELFDQLCHVVREKRSVRSLEEAGCLPGATFVSDPIQTAAIPADRRCDERTDWFSNSMKAVEGCSLVFADPDNGLIDDSSHRRRQKKFGKQMPFAEASRLSEGRQTVIYHHNTRFPGGHDLEVAALQEKLGVGTLAVRANAFNCRTFFIVNPTEETRARVIEFCHRWSAHKVRLNLPPSAPGRAQQAA